MAYYSWPTPSCKTKIKVVLYSLDDYNVGRCSSPFLRLLSLQVDILQSLLHMANVMCQTYSYIPDNRAVSLVYTDIEIYLHHIAIVAI